MEPWRVVEIVALSVIAGALLPAILQLRATLRTMQVRLEGTSDRLDRALDQIGAAAVRLNRATDALDDGRRVRELMDSIQSLSRTVNQLRRSAQLATAVGAAAAPAIAAAVRALRAQPADAPIETRRDRPAPPPSSEAA